MPCVSTRLKRHDQAAVEHITGCVVTGPLPAPQPGTHAGCTHCAWEESADPLFWNQPRVPLPHLKIPHLIYPFASPFITTAKFKS